MDNNGLLPVYKCALDMLVKSDKPYFYKKDIEEAILNFRFNKNSVDWTGIKKELAHLGFTKENIDKIINHISWKMRFTVYDVVDIKKNLLEKGYLFQGRGHKIFLNNELIKKC